MKSDPEPFAARLTALDALRGVAILAVVALHVSFDFLRQAPFPSRPGTILLACHLLTGFAVPLFVAVSTASLSLGRWDAGGVRRYGAFLAARARRVLPPYVAWSLVMLIRQYPDKLLHPTTVAYLLMIGGIHYHLYFVPLICQLYLAWPLLHPLGRSAARSLRHAALIAIVGFAVSFAWWRLAAAGVVPNVTLTLVPLWFGYATLGLAAARWLRPALARSRNRNRNTALVIAVTGATFAATVMIHHVHAMVLQHPAAVGMAVTIFQLPSALYAVTAMALVLVVVARLEGSAVYRVLAGLGRRSYGIYLVHVLLLEMIVYRCVGRPDGALFATGWWAGAILIAWVAAVALSDALVRVLAASALLRPIAGIAPDRLG